MRTELEERTKKAELAIVKVLQEFHEETGLIPSSFEFSTVDTRCIEDHQNGKRRVAISNYQLHASI